MTTFVNIEDGKVNAVFTAPQDPETFPNVVEVEDDDKRLKAFFKSYPVTWPQEE